MKILEYIPGFALVIILALFSYYVSTLHASFDALVISIIMGMFFGNLISERDYFRKGVEGAIEVFLPLGIALYGTQLIFNNLEWTHLLSIFLVFSALFGLTLLFSRIFDVNRKTSLLLAAGLSVCGASAIAVISPLIGAKKEETSISIISVMMLGLTGMVFYPIAYDLFALSRDEFAFFAGMTLPMLGQVKVASGSVCQDCLQTAVKIKLIRISFLVFLVSIAVFFSGKEERQVKVPWFILVFILLALLVNTAGVLQPFLGYFKSASTFFLSATLAAIGFSVDFDAIVEIGIIPLAVILLSWSIVLLVIFFGVSIF